MKKPLEFIHVPVSNMPLESQPSEAEHHHRIELIAYHLWEERGCPNGTPDVDWFRAEEESKQQLEVAPVTPGVKTLAQAVGSAIGSVAGLVSTVSHLVRSEPSKSE